MRSGSGFGDCGEDRERWAWVSGKAGRKGDTGFLDQPPSLPLFCKIQVLDKEGRQLLSHCKMLIEAGRGLK